MSAHLKPKAKAAVGEKTTGRVVKTAITSSDEGRSTSEWFPRRSRKVVHPHMWPVCANLAKFGRGEG